MPSLGAVAVPVEVPGPALAGGVGVDLVAPGDLYRQVLVLLVGASGRGDGEGTADGDVDVLALVVDSHLRVVVAADRLHVHISEAAAHVGVALRVGVPVGDGVVFRTVAGVVQP